MAKIQPGLTLDLHEYSGDAFWFSARHQRGDDDQMWEQRMTDQMILAVAQSGAKLALADYLPRSFFTKSERGVFWLDSQKRGEGLNLADFAANRYGLFTIETGMKASFEHRGRVAMLAAQTSVTAFEQRCAS